MYKISQSSTSVSCEIEFYDVTSLMSENQFLEGKLYATCLPMGTNEKFSLRICRGLSLLPERIACGIIFPSQLTMSNYRSSSERF